MSIHIQADITLRLLWVPLPGWWCSGIGMQNAKGSREKDSDVQVGDVNLYRGGPVKIVFPYPCLGSIQRYGPAKGMMHGGR